MRVHILARWRTPQALSFEFGRIMLPFVFCVLWVLGTVCSTGKDKGKFGNSAIYPFRIGQVLASDQVKSSIKC